MSSVFLIASLRWIGASGFSEEEFVLFMVVARWIAVPAPSSERLREGTSERTNGEHGKKVNARRRKQRKPPRRKGRGPGAEERDGGK